MRQVDAVIWDFDNTLVDTGARNLSVTRRLVTHITGRHPDEFPMLRGRESYERTLHRTLDWQTFYAEQFGMEPDQIRLAGRLWTEFQLADGTPTRWFEGVRETIETLSHLPQGIVSLNTRDNIEANLDEGRMRDAFGAVIGCGEVPPDRQKPSPDGLMACVEMLCGDAAGLVVYIGDHPVDAECAREADRGYARAGRAVRVVSIGAAYGTAVPDAPWSVEPLHTASSPSDIPAILASLAS
ncbi:MAG: HAD family hydrolase [Gemmatimonadota bacterium]|nr:HAD family hydrolase [Gemmatimonadota bacterium]